MNIKVMFTATEEEISTLKNASLLIKQIGAKGALIDTLTKGEDTGMSYEDFTEVGRMLDILQGYIQSDEIEEQNNKVVPIKDFLEITREVCRKTYSCENCAFSPFCCGNHCYGVETFYDENEDDNPELINKIYQDLKNSLN